MSPNTDPSPTTGSSPPANAADAGAGRLSGAPTAELANVVAQLSGLLLTRETLDRVLGLATSLAVETVAGATGAGVTLVDGRGRRTSAASTSHVVEEADAVQYELDEGPCLAAWASRAPQRVDDTRTEQRWPRWAAAAARLGLRSSLSTPLIAGDAALGAIKVYATEPNAFSDRAEHLLSLFSAQAAILLANVQAYEDARKMSEQLKTALQSRDVIGQAKGILMNSRGVDADAAFALLVTASQHQNRKLHDVAADIVAATTRRRR